MIWTTRVSHKNKKQKGAHSTPLFTIWFVYYYSSIANLAVYDARGRARQYRFSLILTKLNQLFGQCVIL